MMHVIMIYEIESKKLGIEEEANQGNKGCMHDLMVYIVFKFSALTNEMLFFLVFVYYYDPRENQSHFQQDYNIPRFQGT